MRLSHQHLSKARKSPDLEPRRGVASSPCGSQAIASWKEKPRSACRTPLRKLVDVFLLALTIAVVTVLSGIGLWALYQENLEVSNVSSDEFQGADSGSDPRLQELLQAHRAAMLGR